MAGLVTAGLVATSTVATATPAVAADGRADILSITVSNPTPGDMDCQDLQVSTTWNVAQGYDVFSARMHFTNNDGTDDSGFDTADVSPQLYAYGQSTRLSTWLYCPGLDGTGSFTAGNTETVIYDETTGDQVAVTSPVTTTFGAPILAPPVPTPVPTPVPMPVPTPPPPAPGVVATASRLVVTRPDGGAKLDFDVYTKAVGQMIDEPVVQIQQHTGTGWITVGTVGTIGGYANFTRKDRNRHAYRVLVPADPEDGYAANVSATVTPVVTGARPATAAERKLLLRAAQKWSVAHGAAYLDATKTRVSTSQTTWAESIVHARPNGNAHWVPALVIFHYSGGWKVFRGVNYPKDFLSCAGVPHKVQDDLSFACQATD